MPRKTRLLIVDDDEFVRLSYSEILATNNNYLIETAANGEEALDRLAHEHYDQMLLDLMMPDMTGFDVLMELRTQGRLCPSIISSGYGDASTLLYSLSLGVVDFLTKPVGPKDLITMVANVLSRQEKYSQMRVSNIHNLGKDDLISFSLYCIQYRNFNHARLSLKLLNAKYKEKSCRILLGMLEEVEKNFPESEKCYLQAACLG